MEYQDGKHPQLDITNCDFKFYTQFSSVTFVLLVFFSPIPLLRACAELVEVGWHGVSRDGGGYSQNAFCKLLFKRAKYFLSFLFVLTQKETKKSRRFDTTHKPPLLARSARPPHASSWEDLYSKDDCSSERECKIGISARLTRNFE